MDNLEQKMKQLTFKMIIAGWIIVPTAFNISFGLVDTVKQITTDASITEIQQ